MKLLAILGVTLLLLVNCSKAKADEESSQLVYWSLWNKTEPQAQALLAIGKDFAQQKNGAEIKTIFNGRQALVKLRSYLAANNQVDIFDGDGDQFMGLVSKEDLVADLADLVAAKNYSGEQSFSDSMLRGTLDTLRLNDVQYGVPYVVNIIAFFYSQQAFAKAGVGEPPKSLAELLQVSDQLLAAGIDPIALEGNVGFYQLWYFTSIMQKIAGDNFLYDVIMDKTGASWNKPQVRLALEREEQLIDSGAIPPESSGYQYPAAQNNIAIGKTAMELVGSWLPTELSQAVDADFRWGIFPFPSVEGGQNQNKIALAPMAIAIHKDSRHITTAEQFIRYLLSADSQQKMVKLGNVGVPNKDVSWPEDLKDAKDMLLNSDGAYLSDGNLSAFLPDFTTNILQPAHTEFILGKLSIAEFIAKMQESTAKYWQQQ